MSDLLSDLNQDLLATEEAEIRADLIRVDENICKTITVYHKGKYYVFDLLNYLSNDILDKYLCENNLDHKFKSRYSKINIIRNNENNFMFINNKNVSYHRKINCETLLFLSIWFGLILLISLGLVLIIYLFMYGINN